MQATILQMLDSGLSPFNVAAILEIPLSWVYEATEETSDLEFDN